MGNLRDEHYPSGIACACGWEPSLLTGPQDWEQWRGHMAANMKRALAVERAATIEECRCRVMDGLAEHSQVSPIFLSGIRWCVDKLATVPCDRSALAAERVATIEKCKSTAIVPGITGGRALEGLPCDRSALDDALTQVRTEMFDEFFSVAAARYGIPAGKHSPESILAAVAAQARREQREKDAEISENWNFWSEKPGPTKTAQGGIATAIRAQED